jgi:hypothetical protein
MPYIDCPTSAHSSPRPAVSVRVVAQARCARAVGRTAADSPASARRCPLSTSSHNGRPGRGPRRCCVCHLPGMSRNGGTAHSATDSVSSLATCNPCWTALAACTGGEGADASACEEDVEVSAGVWSVVITCRGEGVPWGVCLPAILSTIESGEAVAAFC